MSAQTESAEPPSSGGSQGATERWPEGASRPPHPEIPPAEALRRAFAHVARLREYAAYYVAARLDALKATVRNIGIYAGLCVIGLIAVGAMVVMAVVLLLRGIAGAFAQLFSGHPWLGDIITAVIVLALLAGGVIFSMKMLARTFRSQVVKKYEDRLRQQRQQFGRDVSDEAQSVERSAPR